MAKSDKKKEKLERRVSELEERLRSSLHKKAAGPAIDAPACVREIAKLKTDLAAMK